MRRENITGPAAAAAVNETERRLLLPFFIVSTQTECNSPSAKGRKNQLNDWSSDNQKEMAVVRRRGKGEVVLKESSRIT